MTARNPAELNPVLYAEIVTAALREDLGRAGDLTSEAIVSDQAKGKARVIARADGTVAGLPLAVEVFRRLDPDCGVKTPVREGSVVKAGDCLLEIRGRVRALLTAERTALNFLGWLSGIATLTAAMVENTRGTKTRIACTRKTTPGQRVLEKYAVRVGGGRNHRFGLDDAVLIKENHLVAAGGIQTAVERVHGIIGHLVKVEVEVETLEELDQAVEAGVDAVLLDNMEPGLVREAVKRTAGRVVLEASGGIGLEQVRSLAQAGVDVISVGRLTHSAPALDLSMQLSLT